MNTNSLLDDLKIGSSHFQAANLADYCVLPVLHTHSHSLNYLKQEHEFKHIIADNISTNSLGLNYSTRGRNLQRRLYLNWSTTGGGIRDGLVALAERRDIYNDWDQLLSSAHTIKSASTTGGAENLLDPYIDAVQVKNRVNNKRGDRVGAADATSGSQIKRVSLNHKSIEGVQYAAKPSHYSKIVHIEESKEANEHWDYSSGDSDTDSDDDNHEDVHAGHHHVYGNKHGGKHGGVVMEKKKYIIKRPKRKKRKRRKKKKVYDTGKDYYSDGKDYGGHQEYHEKPKTKKIVYVKLNKKPIVKEYHHKGRHKYHYKDKHYHDDHDDHHKFKKLDYEDDHHHHHHYNYHGKSKGKFAHLDLTSKGKMSLAGLLGYTLLCVNYVLVMKQPSYDKYHTAGYSQYSKYSPHGASSEHYLKSSGPVILAHCNELPETRALVHAVRDGESHGSYSWMQMNASNDSRSEIIQTDSSQQVTMTGSRSNETLLQTQPNNLGETRETQKAEIVSQRNWSSQTAAASPPSYYYTLMPSSRYTDGNKDHQQQQQLVNVAYGAQQQIGSNQGYNRGLLSPVQDYLSRMLLLPSLGSSSNNNNYPGVTDYDDSQLTLPIRVLGSPAVRGQRLITGRGQQVDGISERQQPLVGVMGANARFGAGGRRVIVVNGQPQIVGTRDNLVDMRTRQIAMSMRVAEGRRFGIPRRAVALTNAFAPPQVLANPQDDQEASRGAPAVAGIAVRAPEREERMQNDQPSNGGASEVNATPPASAQQSLEGNNNNANQLLDMPDYALDGDSIELTCNHRTPISRLYSVKWFKDALEFYRFVPANAPQSKSALFLPGVRIDLARSGPQSVFLQNVTHRASGTYRCEVVAEAPTFELMSGEKRMQVYSLPDVGPQLSLLQGPATSLATEGPLVVTTGRRQAALGATLAQQRQRMGQRENNDDDDDDGDERLALARPGAVETLPRLERESGGPLVRCSSDRSNPVAQLRFFINNRPVELARTIENSTISYSDGLESNVVSFRVQLSDFVLQASELERDNNALSRAAASSASLELNQNKTNSKLSSAPGISTTRMPSAPSVKLSTSAKDKPRKQGEFVSAKNKGPASGGGNVNAEVKFDDHAHDGLITTVEPVAAKRKAKNRKNTTKKQEKRRMETDKRAKQGIGDNENNLDDDYKANSNDQAATNVGDAVDAEHATEESADDARQLQHDVVVSAVPQALTTSTTGRASTIPLPAQPRDSMSQFQGEIVADGYRRLQAMKNDSNLTEISRISRSSNSPQADGGNMLGLPSKQRSKTEISVSTQQSELDKEEQRIATTFGTDSRLGSPQQSNDELAGQQQKRRRQRQQQREQRVYSNFIRIKCSSSVPTVGYEMVSELNVPLTLLVPASQMSDALRQEMILERATGHTQEMTGGSGASAPRGRQTIESQSARSNRNGGSLQAPRAVSIDRVAQASGPAFMTIINHSGRIQARSSAVSMTANQTLKFLLAAISAYLTIKQWSII